MPTGDRTAEAWIWSDNAGARPIAYGDFSFEVTERGISVGGTALNLPPTDNRRLTDSRWHHVAVTVSGTTLTAYLDGAAFATAQKTLSTVTTGELFGARIPAGATVAYDEIAVYPSALSAERIKAHFDASFNALPGQPQGLQADTSQANTLTLSYYGPAFCYCAPLHQNVIDRYVAEAWKGDQLVATQSIADGPGYATFTGLPAGAYTLKVRAYNAYGAGPVATIDATATRRRRRPTCRPSRTTTPSSTGAWASAAARSSPTAPATSTSRPTTRPPTSAPTRARSRPTPTARWPTAAPGTRRATT